MSTGKRRANKRAKLFGKSTGGARRAPKHAKPKPSLFKKTAALKKAREKAPKSPPSVETPSTPSMGLPLAVGAPPAIVEHENESTPKPKRLKTPQKAKASTSSKKSKLKLAAIGAGAIGVAALGTMLYLTRHPVLPAAVPQADFGTEQASLCEPFVKEEVRCIIRWRESDSPVGALISQTPEAGSRSDSVTVVYSIGADSIKTPIVAGLQEEDARRLLWESGLKAGKVTESDSSAPKGTVISASSNPGTVVANGTAIDLVVSSGMVTVPDWSGKTKELVVAEASKLGIKIDFVPVKNNDKPQDIVLAQSNAGERVPNTTTVEVKISQKSNTKRVRIPRVVGMSQQEAISTLAASGFTKIKTTFFESTAVSKARVIGTDPEPGTLTEITKEIDLLIEAPAK